MNSNIARKRIIEISGDNNFEIGLSHGTQLQKEIEVNIDFYLKTFNQSHEIVKNLALGFYERVKSFDKNYTEEMEGIAEGAKVPLWQISMLNARSEIFSIFKKQGQNKGITECTLLFFPETAIIAENWDWAIALSEQTFILKIIKNKQNPILTLSEAGILAKIGLNSFGIGIGMNYLEPISTPNGLPVHILIRKALESDSFEKARGVFIEYGLGTSGNICLAHSSGAYVGFELDGEKVLELENNNTGYYCHTNHYLGKPDTNQINNIGDATTSTSIRFLQAQSLATNAMQSFTETEARAILMNQDHPKFPILVPRTTSESLGEIGTIASIIINLKKLELSVSSVADGFKNNYSFNLK